MLIIIIRIPRAEKCGPPGGATMSMNLENRQQQSSIRFALRTKTMIQDVNLAFSADHCPPLLSFCSTAIRWQYRYPALSVVAPPTLVRCSNRPFGRTNTKRLIISRLTWTCQQLDVMDSTLTLLAYQRPAFTSAGVDSHAPS